MTAVMSGAVLAPESVTLDPVLRQRLVGRIETDGEVPNEMARRILDQTIVFLRLCAAEPDAGHAPSRLVDVGWHTFILYTQNYRAFCLRVAGQFIHHSPTDEPGRDCGPGGVARTVQALKDHGFPVDEELWISAETECSVPCDARCHRACDSAPPTPSITTRALAG